MVSSSPVKLPRQLVMKSPIKYPNTLIGLWREIAMYTCASCTIHACRTGERDKLPKNCPIRNGELMENAFEQYGTEENHRFYVESSKIESAGLPARIFHAD